MPKQCELYTYGRYKQYKQNTKYSRVNTPLYEFIHNDRERDHKHNDVKSYKSSDERALESHFTSSNKSTSCKREPVNMK